jgi:hypothetical protein
LDFCWKEVILIHSFCFVPCDFDLIRSQVKFKFSSTIYLSSCSDLIWFSLPLCMLNDTWASWLSYNRCWWNMTVCCSGQPVLFWYYLYDGHLFNVLLKYSLFEQLIYKEL